MHNTLVLLFFSGLILTGGDILMKYWTINTKTTFYVAGLAVYVMGLMLFVETLKEENVAVASAILVMVNIISLLIIGWLFFGEPYSHTKLWGIFFALCSIVLLEIGN